METDLKQKDKQISNVLDKIGRKHVMISNLNKYLEDQKSLFVAQITQLREEKTAINKEKRTLKIKLKKLKEQKRPKLLCLGIMDLMEKLIYSFMEDILVRVLVQLLQRFVGTFAMELQSLR